MAYIFKTVSIMKEDYELFDTIRKDWVKKHKANISMPQMLKIAMEKYQEKV